eukprot:CAMPEP_0206506464 /NCGR_PEP_ID=MMETSP0324_2-20121206/56783_1 /ASSEMBLY_ACC=CAM_ASM_000836 /TAXON_ID=2866 /ORGANISM="Crypthecodinium cohnii, Strain Seligo" /LENGTH=64 /DNA_ID=CAMNT_0053996203 /DNA_START=618 /DNA_END=815 /DNA_ORIENTATION=-
MRLFWWASRPAMALQEKDQGSTLVVQVVQVVLWDQGRTSIFVQVVQALEEQGQGSRIHPIVLGD